MRYKNSFRRCWWATGDSPTDERLLSSKSAPPQRGVASQQLSAQAPAHTSSFPHRNFVTFSSIPRFPNFNATMPLQSQMREWGLEDPDDAEGHPSSQPSAINAATGHLESAEAAPKGVVTVLPSKSVRAL